VGVDDLREDSFDQGPIKRRRNSSKKGGKGKKGRRKIDPTKSKRSGKLTNRSP